MPADLYAENLPPAVEHIVVLRNPYSRNLARGERHLQRLVEYSGLMPDSIETSPDPDETAERLNGLEPTDLLYVIGGDGTVNQTIGSLIRSQALLLPSRSGNANDLSMAVNGHTSPWRVFRGFKRKEIASSAIHPIEVNINAGDIIHTALALNYASVGYAALASNYVNRPWQHPNLKRIIDTLPGALQTATRLPRDGHALGKAAWDAQHFAYAEHGAVEWRPVVDVSVVHSRRMAKFGKFNIDHTQPDMLSSVLTRTGFLAMAYQYTKMVRGKMVVEQTAGLAFCAENIVGNPFYYQVDGEASPLPDRCNVKIALGSESLRILGKRLDSNAVQQGH